MDFTKNSQCFLRPKAEPPVPSGVPPFGPFALDLHFGWGTNGCKHRFGICFSIIKIYSPCLAMDIFGTGLANQQTADL